MRLHTELLGERAGHLAVVKGKAAAAFGWVVNAPTILTLL